MMIASKKMSVVRRADSPNAWFAGESFVVGGNGTVGIELGQRYEVREQVVARVRRGETERLARVFSWHEGHLSAIYQRAYIDGARGLPGVPPYTIEQLEALDLLDELADDPALRLRMEFLPGDVQFVHNHTLLHDRTAFEDWPEPEGKRHLLRLWLAPENARPLPLIFAERFGSLTPGDRGGVIVDGTILNAPLDVT